MQQTLTFIFTLYLLMIADANQISKYEHYMYIDFSSLF